MNFLAATCRCLALFCLTLSTGVLFQLIVSFVAPSVQMASLDGGIFRSWSGFGLRETACLASLLAGLFAVAKLRTHADDKSDVNSLIFGCSAGTLLSIVVFTLALRLPPFVAVVWCGQVLLQILTAGLAATWIAGKSSRSSLLVSLGAILCVTACLALAYAIPTPIPDESFSINVPQIGQATIDCFLPEGEGPYSAVVIFHGVEGATNLTRRFVHYPNAKAVSEKGYATFFVRYFDPYPYDHLMLLKDGNLSVPEVEKTRTKDFQGWIEIASAAMQAIQQRDDVTEMAVIGYSLGCYVGTAASSRTSQFGYPQAFVGNFGGIWPEVEIAATFPPSRFYHGELDTVVPVAQAKQAIEKIKAAGASDVALVTYPDQGHLPEGPTSSVIRTSTESFLKLHLSGSQ